MSSPAPPPFEEEILRAIAAGDTHDELLRASTWTASDVEHTLVRHGLVVTPGGSIVPAGKTSPALLRLAEESPSLHVRKAAARATAALVALAGAVARDQAAQSAEAVRRAQKQAVSQWINELKRLEHEAQAELRRLTKPRPRSRRAG